MKLLSWNVNGLRACMGKGFMDFFTAEAPDCLCLQETKLQAGQIDLVLTKSISRFARNTLDLLRIVRRLKEIGVEVWFQEENIRTLSAEGELMMTILASMCLIFFLI